MTMSSCMAKIVARLYALTTLRTILFTRPYIKHIFKQF